MPLRKEGITQVNTGGAGPVTDVEIVAPIGQDTSANSVPVVIASDQSDVPVSSATLGLEATLQLIKTAVEIIDNFISGARGLVTEDNSLAILTRLNLLLADATFTGRINTLGQKTMAASTPVVIASNQSNLFFDNPTIENAVTSIANALGVPDAFIGRALTFALDKVDVSGSVVSTKQDLTPSAPAAASVGVASAQAVAANANRKGLKLTNTSNARISLGFGSAAVLDSGDTLYPGGTFYMDEYDFDLGAVNAIASAAASNLGIQEYTT